MDRLAAMETFVRVVDAGSFSNAAKVLRVGQPAVSKTVAQLEDRLGVRLLLRSTQGLTPTEAGWKFYEGAKRSLAEADDAEHTARDAGTGLTGRLRVCAPVTFARMHVIPQLPSFLAEHASLNIDVVLDDRNIDLVEQGIDLALRMGRLSDSSLTARKIGESARLVVGTPDYFANFGTPKTPRDLIMHQAIIYEQGEGGTNWAFQKGNTARSITLGGRLHVSAAEGVREGVLAGMGLAIASEWMFAPELATKAVIPVLTDWSLPAIDLWIVSSSGRQMSTKAKTFASFVEHCLTNIQQNS